MSKQCVCGSYAINDHPESVLCDKCWWKEKAEQAEAALQSAQKETVREICKLLDERGTRGGYVALRHDLIAAIKSRYGL